MVPIAEWLAVMVEGVAGDGRAERHVAARLWAARMRARRLTTARHTNGRGVVLPSVMGKRLECEELGGQYMVTKAGSGDLSCIPADVGEVSQLGKRYTCADCGAMVLCTKAGTGRCACDGAPMELLAAKALPSSD
jgi:hypothetical protein